MVFWSFFRFEGYFGHFIGFGGCFDHFLCFRDIFEIFRFWGISVIFRFQGVFQ